MKIFPIPSDTLDDVCDRGATTDQTIAVRSLDLDKSDDMTPYLSSLSGITDEDDNGTTGQHLLVTPGKGGDTVDGQAGNGGNLLLRIGNRGSTSGDGSEGSDGIGYFGFNVEREIGFGQVFAVYGLHSSGHQNLFLFSAPDVDYIQLTLATNKSEAGDFYYYGTDNPTTAYFALSHDLKIGVGLAGKDYKLTFDGETNDGVITWMEDEDYFKFGDDIYLPDGENLIFGTVTGTKIGTGTTQKIGFWNTTPVVQNTSWSVSNAASDKSFDANATTLDEIADVLGTLIDTLKTYGILGA